MQEHQPRLLRRHHDGRSHLPPLPQTRRTPQLPPHQRHQVQTLQLEHSQLYLRPHPDKVLSRLGLSLTPEDCRRLSSSTPLAVEALLFEFKGIVAENSKEREEEERRQVEPQREKDVQGISNKLFAASKVEELKEVLGLLK